MRTKKETAPGTRTETYKTVVAETINYNANLVKNNEKSKSLVEIPRPEEVVSVADALAKNLAKETRGGRLHMVQDVNKLMQEQILKPPVTALTDLWNEKEVCCCFSAPGVGKSLFAVQIGCSIAESKNCKVLYFDYELSDEQFFLRYHNNGVSYLFPEGFKRICIDVDKWESDTTAEDIINDMEETAEDVGANIMIVDNITWLSDRLEKGEEAGPVMKRFIQMKKRGYSLLLIAHTPKRETLQPVELKDLYGSSKIGQFIDSCFALNFCNDEKKRYVKQLKARIGEIKYGANNVCVYAVDQGEDGLTKLVFKGFSSERECIGGSSFAGVNLNKEKVISRLLELYPHCNISKLAKAIGVTHPYIFDIKKGLQVTPTQNS